MSKTTYNGAVTWVEYYDRVDIRPVDRGNGKSPLRGIIHTHVTKNGLNALSDGLMTRALLTYFDMAMKPFIDGKRVWVTLTPKSDMVLIGASIGLATLLMFLSINKYPIVWKEDKHGYEIDDHGNVKRKWSLNPY